MEIQRQRARTLVECRGQTHDCRSAAKILHATRTGLAGGNPSAPPASCLNRRMREPHVRWCERAEGATPHPTRSHTHLCRHSDFFPPRLHVLVRGNLPPVGGEWRSPYPASPPHFTWYSSSLRCVPVTTANPAKVTTPGSPGASCVGTGNADQRLYFTAAFQPACNRLSTCSIQGLK